MHTFTCMNKIIFELILLLSVLHRNISTTILRKMLPLSYPRGGVMLRGSNSQHLSDPQVKTGITFSNFRLYFLNEALKIKPPASLKQDRTHIEFLKEWKHVLTANLGVVIEEFYSSHPTLR